MADRLPLDLADQRRQRDRDVGQHEQREGKDIEYLLPRRALDLLPFRSHRKRAKQEQAERNALERCQQDAAQHAQHAVCNERGLGQAAQAGQQRQRQHADRHQIAGGDRHQHIIAGHALFAAARAAVQQRRGVLGVHLIKALAPAQALVPGLAELDRLLVINHCRAAVADLAATHRTRDGELDILGQQMVRPAVFLADHVARNQEARAGNRAVDAQAGARTVEEARLAQKPQRVACGDPVVAEVLGVAVAGQRRILAGVEHLVHLADEVGVHQIIRVEYEKAVVGLFALIRKDALEQPVQRVALADLHLVESLVHDRARLAGNRRRAVRAVVGHDEYVQQLFRVILRLEVPDQIPDDPLLIAG